MKKIGFYLSAILIFALVSSCEKDEKLKVDVETTAVSEITSLSAKTGGVISGDFTKAVTARGVCWAKTENPTTEDSKTEDGEGKSSFESLITGLEEVTKYYVRAYAVVDGKTFYGNQLDFTTIVASAPTVTTEAVSDLTISTAKSGGTITDAGSSPITACGVCWSESPNPTIADSKTTDTPTDNKFVSELTGLKVDTKYYVKSYATSDVGTSYGEEKNFTIEQLDLGVSNLTGDVSHPGMTGRAHLERLEVNESAVIWKVLIYEKGYASEPSGIVRLDFCSPVNGLNATIPSGTYKMALQNSLQVHFSLEPGYKDLDNYDAGTWYFYFSGSGFSKRASAIGGLGEVMIEHIDGSGDEAVYKIEYTFYDTNGYKISGDYEGIVLDPYND